MAALKESIFRYISRTNSKASAAQLVFYRGITSKLFVKVGPSLQLFAIAITMAFFAGLSFSTTEGKLAEAFSQFGQLVEAKIITDKTRNRSKGYGYVTFSSEEEAKKALTDMNGKSLDGRIIFVDNAWPNRRVARGPSKQSAKD